MKRLLIYVTVIAAASCAGKAAPDLTPEPKDPNGVMRLIGRSSFAHACPVDGLVLSAAHVIRRRNHLLPPLSWPHHYSWSDGHQGSGYVRSLALLPRDLGVLLVISGTPKFYRHATIEPKPGDVLRWQEFDLRTRKKAFKPREVRATIQHLVSGHFVMDDPPTRGASGSCALNDANEVAAIVVWSVGVDSGESVGMVVSVAGPWWPGE